MTVLTSFVTLFIIHHSSSPFLLSFIPSPSLHFHCSLTLYPPPSPVTWCFILTALTISLCTLPFLQDYLEVKRLEREVKDADISKVNVCPELSVIVYIWRRMHFYLRGYYVSVHVVCRCAHLYILLYLSPHTTESKPTVPESRGQVWKCSIWTWITSQKKKFCRELEFSFKYYWDSSSCNCNHALNI